MAVDVEPRKLELACRLGAAVGLSPRETDVVAEILRLTAGRGADLAVEAVGIPATVSTAISAVRKGAQSRWSETSRPPSNSPSKPS